MPHMCPVDRYNIDDLAARLVPFVADPDTDSIAEFLRTNVNQSNDRVPVNMRDRFTPEGSIGGFETFIYLQRRVVNGSLGDGSMSSQIALGLNSLFFGGGDPLRNPPHPHPFIPGRRPCHDADTCTITEAQNSDCQLTEVESTVRGSGYDAPEVGNYGDEWSPKLNSNADLLREEWLGNAQLTKRELKLVNRLIAMHIDYTGRLAALIRNDLNRWNGTEGLPRLYEESQIEWVWEGEGDQTPPVLCGTWQPFDMYGRRLGSFYQMYPSYLDMYMQQRLPELMNSEEVVKYYEQYREKVKVVVERLREVDGKMVFALVQRLENDLPDPRVIFSAKNCNLMLNAFREFTSRRGEHYLIDDALMLIITGAVYAYDKYRNQDGDAYFEAGEIARQNGFGSWNEETFRTIYMINERDNHDRYHPPRCPAQ